MKLMINDHGTIVFYIRIPHPSFSTLEIPFSLLNPFLIHFIFFTQSLSHSFYFLYSIPFSFHLFSLLNPFLIHSNFFTQSPSHSFYFTVLFYNDQKTCGKISILTLISDQTKFSVFFSWVLIMFFNQISWKIIVKTDCTFSNYKKNKTLFEEKEFDTFLTSWKRTE